MPVIVRHVHYIGQGLLGVAWPTLILNQMYITMGTQLMMELQCRLIP
jgi:hypothetical protein